MCGLSFRSQQHQKHEKTMPSDIVLARLRHFLLIISAGVFIMTVTELIFLGHWNETIQFLPFVLSALGLTALALVYFRPNRTSLTMMRWSMIVIGGCSFIGFYMHLSLNLKFWLEVQPSATTWDLIKAALKGENPALAPGILLLGAVIGLAAIYRHPLLEAR
jgi:hypothetical protein